LEAVQAEIEEEREARIRAECALTEAQKDLKAAQEEIGQERQARAKAEQTRDEAEKALTEKMRTPGIEVWEGDNASIGVDENGAEQRVSFVVRLTVDERRQPKRTEIEHPLSGKKVSFPSLDAQRMAAFMKACIGPQAVSIPAPSAGLSPTKANVVKPNPEMSATTLTVRDVQVVRRDVSGIPASFLNSDEAFAVQVRFQLPRLPTGSHRMLTLVALYEPVKMISHYDGPVVRVPGKRSPADLVTTKEGPVP
jgi:hypothetical protein